MIIGIVTLCDNSIVVEGWVNTIVAPCRAVVLKLFYIKYDFYSKENFHSTKTIKLVCEIFLKLSHKSQFPEKVSKVKF